MKTTPFNFKLKISTLQFTHIHPAYHPPPTHRKSVIKKTSDIRPASSKLILVTDFLDFASLLVFLLLHPPLLLIIRPHYLLVPLRQISLIAAGIIIGVPHDCLHVLGVAVERLHVVSERILCSDCLSDVFKHLFDHLFRWTVLEVIQGKRQCVWQLRVVRWLIQRLEVLLLNAILLN